MRGSERTSDATGEPDRRRLTAVELFSGAGGMALGFEQAGFDVLAAADVDPVHMSTHERNFPLCEPICEDITELTAADVLAAAREGWKRRYSGSDLMGRVDCVFGGPSCQGFSVIGRRELNDPRNLLISEFARLVGELRPRWFVLENVPGLISPGYQAVLDKLYHSFRKVGYKVADPWRLNARDFGVPQERKRIFIVGARKGQPLPRIPVAQETLISVADAPGNLRGLGRFRRLFDEDSIKLTERQLAAIQERQSAYVRRLNGLAADADFSDRRKWDPRNLTSVGLTDHSAGVRARFRKISPGDRDEVGRLPRLDPAGQSPTLRAGTGRDHGSFTSARPLHHLSPRVITVREAARLHGFPDWFGFHATKWNGFRQVGNAVPPPLARGVAATIMAAAKARPSRRKIAITLGPHTLLEPSLREAAMYYDLDLTLLPRDVRRAA
jgi:DNA (cytosine-5)-methyltransferase 1